MGSNSVWIVPVCSGFVKENPRVENKGNDAWKIVQIAPSFRQQGIYCKTSCLRLIKKVLLCWQVKWFPGTEEKDELLENASKRKWTQSMGAALPL